MFERFTRLARTSIDEARAAADELGHNFIGTEHQLLGILRLDDGVACAVLAEAGVTLAEARAAVVDAIGPTIDRDALAAIGIDVESVRQAAAESFGAGALERALSGARVSGSGPAFTPRAKKVMELALRQAKALGHNYIGTEHLLLALVREGHGVAAVVLRQLAPGTDFRRLTLERLRAAS